MRFDDNSDGTIKVEWTLEYHALEEIGYIVQAAGIGPKGQIRDRGFYDDGTELLEAAWQAQEREQFGS
jgi:hypothetical protein